MKRFLLLIILISLNMYSFAQRTNNRGEYLVKSVHWVNVLTQKSVGDKGDKWYYFKYDNNGKLIEIKKVFYQKLKYKTIELFTIVNNRYQFISYMNGKQVLNSKCQFTFNKQGYISKLYIYETSGDRYSTVGTLLYNENWELKSIDLLSEQKGGNHYKFHNNEKYVWENGNMIDNKYATNGSDWEFGGSIEYSNVVNNTNINLTSLTKHANSPYNEHIMFATEWCGKKPINLMSIQGISNTFDYFYEDELVYKIVKKNSSYIKGYYLIEYVY